MCRCYSRPTALCAINGPIQKYHAEGLGHVSPSQPKLASPLQLSVEPEVVLISERLEVQLEGKEYVVTRTQLLILAMAVY